jgi:type I restriction enzyme S subunit
VIWPLVKLDNHIEVLSGFAFKSSLFGDSGKPLIRIRDVVGGRSNTYYSGEFSDDYIIRNGDLLVGMDGDFNRGCWKSEDALLNQRVCKLTADGVGLDQDFLYHLLPKELLEIHRNTPAVTVKHLSVKKIKDIEIPLPPLTEQKRIAAILDKADAIRRKRQQAIQLADDFLRAVFLDMFGDPVTNPKGWEVKPIACGIASITSGWSAKGESYPCKSNEYGVLKISSVTSGKFKPEENKFIHNEDIPEGKKLVFPKKGELLFSRANTRELVAATCIVPSDHNNIFLPDKLWNVRTNKELLPEFVNYLIWQPRFKETLTSQATGTSGSMLNISKGKFEATDSIFPPLELQKKFKSIYWKVQELIARLDESLDECGNTFTSLSQKAFSGKL